MPYSALSTLAPAARLADATAPSAQAAAIAWPVTTARRAALAVAEGAATLLLGLMAGFFFAFAVDVAPAMAGLDAATYITVQQAINRVVRNALFGVTYFGGALLPWMVIALALWAGQRRRAGAWAVIALVYAAAVFWVTGRLNVPINETLATWSPSAPPPQWLTARTDWNAANAVRAAASALCFAAAVAVLAWPRRAAG